VLHLLLVIIEDLFLSVGKTKGKYTIDDGYCKDMGRWKNWKPGL
jgi:hypothetical protein